MTRLPTSFLPARFPAKLASRAGATPVAWIGLACVGLAVLAALPALAAPRGVVGAQFRYWFFDDPNDLRNPLAYASYGPLHVQLEYWDWVDPDTPDQFRPEVGLHLRDARRSVYTLQWRHERRQERFWLGTDQVIGDRWVGRASVSPIVSDDETVWVTEVGADFYWSSYSFAQATVVRDGRDDDLWVVPLRVRLATESNDWIQVTVAPASRRTLGWAIDAKRAWVRVGVEGNNRYDFTDRDNVVLTAGVEFPLGPRE